jgi:hypothetical protein
VNLNLKNVIDKPTRVTNHSRILLDPIIVSDTINYVNSDVFELPDNNAATFWTIQIFGLKRGKDNLDN